MLHIPGSTVATAYNAQQKYSVGIHVLNSIIIIVLYPGGIIHQYRIPQYIIIRTTATRNTIQYTKMPLSESASVSITMMWIMAIACVACVMLKSPWGFLFLFGLVWCFASTLKELMSPGGNDASSDRDGTMKDEMEMQPLGKIRGDMTLGEILSRY